MSGSERVFSVGSPTSVNYALDIIEPSTSDPAYASEGENVTIGFSYTSNSEPINHELADISVTSLTVGGQPCLVNQTEGTARDIAQLPGPMADMAAATVRGKAYLVGGRNSDGNLLDAIIEFDPITRKTRVVYILPTPIHLASAVAFEDKVYILGGFARVGGRFETLASVQVYDPIENTSYVVGDLPEPRFWGATSVAGDRIYYGGGIDADGRGSAAIFRVDPSTGGSVQVSTLPTPIAILTATSAYGNVYFIGGLAPAPEFQVDDIVEYDPVANTAAVVATFPPPSGSDGLEAQTAVTLNGKVYVFNGWHYTTSPQERDEIYEFDPIARENATLVGTLPHNVERGAAVDLYGRAYLFGGQNRTGLNQAITEFTPPNATARFVPALQRWRATCSIPSGLLGPSELRMEATYTDHATNQSLSLSATEVSAVIITPPGVRPSEPRNLEVTAGDRQAILTWQEPSHDGGTAISAYEIYRGTASQAEVFLVTVGDIRTYSDTGLTNGVPYYYQLSAVNSNGEGARSAEVFARFATSPSAPGLLVATAGDRLVVLSWLPPGDNGFLEIESYRVYRGTSSMAETLLVTVENVNTHTDTGLSNGVTYYYQVSAANPEGEGPKSNEASATPRSLTLSVFATPASGVAPLTVSFTATVTGGLPPYIYAWAFGDGGTSSDPNPTHAYSSPGAYMARLVVSDAQGTQRTAATSVDVIRPFAVTASANPLTGTIPLTVTFSANPTGGTPPYTFLWDLGDGITSNVPNPTHTYESAGIFTVTLTVSDTAGRTTSATIQINASGPSLPPTQPGIPPTALIVLGLLAGVAIAAAAFIIWWRLRRPPTVKARVVRSPSLT